MIIDDKIMREYFLLRNYQETVQNARELSLRMCFDAMEKIDANNWFIIYDEPNLENKKNNAKSWIQLEIVSKIMFYIEDLAIIFESLLRGTDYYELLDPLDTEKDVGKIIADFFSKINSLSIEDICKIMSYKIPDSYSIDKKDFELMQKMINANIEEVRRILKLIGSFGKEHHPIFRRYKHAGLPFLFRPTQETDVEFLKRFDFSSAVFVKENAPFRDMKDIPFSEDVKEGYKIMIVRLRQLLLRILENRIASIQRGVDGIIPITTFNAQLFSMDELKRMREITEKYLKDNPAKNLSWNYNFQLDLTNESSWYKKLSEFLIECRQIGQLQKETQEKINKALNIDKK